MTAGSKVVVAAALAAALTGCGGEDGGAVEGSPLTGQLAILPGDTYQVDAVDLTSFRSELGLPADANPAEYPDDLGDPGDPESLFLQSGTSLPHVLASQTRFFDPSKGDLSQAIDHSQASAAVDAETRRGTIGIIATGQPFDEIAAGLEERGWAANGDVLEAGRRADVIGFVAEGGGGTVVLASDRAVLEEVVAGDAAGSTVGDLVGDLDESIRSGIELGGGPYCLELLAIGEDPEAREGTLVFDPVGDPDVMLADAAELEGVEFGEPTESEGLVTVSFTDDDAKGLASVRIQSRLSGFGTRELEEVGPGFERSTEPDCPGA